MLTKQPFWISLYYPKKSFYYIWRERGQNSYRSGRKLSNVAKSRHKTPFLAFAIGFELKNRQWAQCIDKLQAVHLQRAFSLGQENMISVFLAGNAERNRHLGRFILSEKRSLLYMSGKGQIIASVYFCLKTLSFCCAMLTKPAISGWRDDKDHVFPHVELNAIKNLAFSPG